MIEGVDRRVEAAFSSDGKVLVVRCPYNREFLTSPGFQSISQKRWIAKERVWMFYYQEYDRVMFLLKKFFPEKVA